MPTDAPTRATAPEDSASATLGRIWRRPRQDGLSTSPAAVHPGALRCRREEVAAGGRLPLLSKVLPTDRGFGDPLDQSRHERISQTREDAVASHDGQALRALRDGYERASSLFRTIARGHG